MIGEGVDERVDNRQTQMNFNGGNHCLIVTIGEVMAKRHKDL